MAKKTAGGGGGGGGGFVAVDPLVAADDLKHAAEENWDRALAHTLMQALYKPTAIIQLYAANASPQFTTTPEVVPFDTIQFHNQTGLGVFEVSVSNHTLKIKDDTNSAWLVEVEVGVKVSIGSSPSTAEAWIERNAIELPGTRLPLYCREVTIGNNSGSTSWLGLIQANDIFRAMCVRVAGSNTLVTGANACRLRATRVVRVLPP
jgi:hypothetical protein